MTARADAQERTRLRIAESAVALHATLGPARTSMSAVAEHAGVRRSTLYRHFPDEAALFSACSALWVSQNPLPDLDTWAAIADPSERLDHALTELYAYYGRVEQMLTNLVRDAETVPAMQQEFGQLRLYFAAAQQVLLAGRQLRGRAGARTKSGIGHALAFATWRSLVRDQSLHEADAVEFMCRAIAASAQPKLQAPATPRKR
jgi:AcrR family transcriptional regulator